MRRKPCPAARLILAELAADIATERYQRTKSWKHRVAMEEARKAALDA